MTAEGANVVPERTDVSKDQELMARQFELLGH